MEYTCKRLNKGLWQEVELFLSATDTNVTKRQMRYGFADALCATAKDKNTLVGVLLGSYFESQGVAQIFAIVVGWPWRERGIEYELYRVFADQVQKKWFCDQVHFVYRPGDETMLDILCKLKPDDTKRLRNLTHSSFEPVMLRDDVAQC
jgi:hypothetical protein